MFTLSSKTQTGRGRKKKTDYVPSVYKLNIVLRKQVNSFI